MVSDYVRRTAITRLRVDAEQRALLDETIAEWKRGCQIAVDLAWGTYTTKHAIQSHAYDEIRSTTSLGSQHAILATHRAAEAITGCVERRQNGECARKPRFTASTIPFDARTMTLFDDGTVSLATTDDRVRCPLALSSSADSYQRRFLESNEWTVTESTLSARDGSFFLHIGFRRQKTDSEQSPPEDGTVLGVDLGIENLAVTSTAFFASGRKLAHRLRQFEKVRGGLQQTGTRSAHRTLVGLSGRAKRYLRDVLHRTSRALVDEALRYECDVIAFERLTHIRDRVDAPWGHLWAFRAIYEQVSYKALSHGIAVRQVSPAYTSQRCSECGDTTAKNRPSRNHFTCTRCGTGANADYNAAKNIGLRYVRRGQQSSRRTGTRRLALKSGTVTPTGGFSAYSEGTSDEFTDKHENRR
ncbi:transposase [Halarchaeum grantii]|uniref:Transposase n=1 Tax=Halarchaeum grantii TaxID=1193105 RepID=A0A830F9Z2_9EURY|nr:RNA-guided endonuclease TnpB family protein [Halarchaeum grantii]GGL34172.1 transposase [Halarchaeum grantii]